MAFIVDSAPEDKPKIVFTAAMMAMQNFGFFLMYFMCYLVSINGAANVSCQDIRFWVGFFALDCFVESFVCVWMAMGGYMSDKCLFIFGWLAHLVVALGYCIATVGVPAALYSDDGKACTKDSGNAAGYVLQAVYPLHLALFMVYVYMMLCQTYWSCVKPSLYGAPKLSNAEQATNGEI